MPPPPPPQPPPPPPPTKRLPPPPPPALSSSSLLKTTTKPLESAVNEILPSSSTMTVKEIPVLSKFNTTPRSLISIESKTPEGKPQSRLLETSNQKTGVENVVETSLKSVNILGNTTTTTTTTTTNNSSTIKDMVSQNSNQNNFFFNTFNYAKWTILEQEEESRRMLEIMEVNEEKHLKLSIETEYINKQTLSKLRIELLNSHLFGVIQEENYIRIDIEMKQMMSFQSILQTYLFQERNNPKEKYVKTELNSEQNKKYLLCQEGKNFVLKAIDNKEKNITKDNYQYQINCKNNYFYLNNSLIMIIQEEQEMRELIKDYQFIFRSHIVSLCIEIFLSPFKIINNMVINSEGSNSLSSKQENKIYSSNNVLFQESEQLIRGRNLLYFFTYIGYDSHIASVYATIFLKHGFAAVIDTHNSLEHNAMCINEILKEITKEDLFRMGISSLGEQTTFLLRVGSFSKVNSKKHYSLLSDTHQDKQISLSPDKNLSNNSNNISSTYLKPSDVASFRASCRAKMQHFDHWAQSKWDKLRSISNIEYDSEWQLRWWEAVREDGRAEVLWEMEMDSLMNSLNSKSYISRYDLPLPYGTKSVSARSLLIDERNSKILSL